MRNRFFTTFGALTLLAAASAFGQQRLAADIPFEFEFGKAVLPAGHYDVNRAFSNTPGAVSLKCRGCGITEMFVLTDRVVVTPAPQKVTLLFNRYGNRYFLSQVTGLDGGNSLRKSTAEREIARNTLKAETGQLVLALR